MKNALIFFLLIISSCKGDIPKEVKYLYANRIDVLQHFENISIDKRGDIRVLTLYCDSLSNIYVFELLDNDLKFIRDSVQFDISEIHKSYLLKEDGIKEYLSFYLDKMMKYNIQFVNSEFSIWGITLKLYFKGGEMFYISDIKHVTHTEWVKYVKSAKKLDKYWYWYPYK